MSLPLTGAGPSAGGFAPPDIAGLKGWYLADVGTYQEHDSKTTPATANNDPVGTWEDQSGNGNDIDTVGAFNTAALAVPGQNGKPVVRFDGATSYLFDAAFSQAQPMTIFVAMKQNANSLDVILSSPAPSLFIFQQRGASPRLQVYAGAWTLDNTDLAVGAFGVLTMVASGAASSLTVNEGVAATGDIGAAGITSGLYVGAISTPASFINADYGEITVYNTALSAPNKASIISYLNARWGAF